MNAAGWYPYRVLAGPDPDLGGSLSPGQPFDGRLPIVRADGRRGDGGPAWRRAAELSLPDGRDLGIRLSRFPNDDPEEGVFGIATVIAAPEPWALLAEIQGRGGSVNVQSALYRTDTDPYTRVRLFRAVEGAEISPLAAYWHNGQIHDFATNQDRKRDDEGSWRAWEVTADGRRTKPRICARGMSGPFPLPGGRMSVLVMHDAPDLRMPELSWWSFDPDTPWILRLEDWQTPPFGVQVRLGAMDGLAYVRDERPDNRARIVVFKPTDDPHPLDLAVPYNLHTDPSSWPATARITSLRFEGGNLRFETEGISGVWPYYESPDQDRAYYGHAVIVVRHEGRWIKVGFEHLGNRPGSPYSVPDDTFEHLGAVPSNPLGPGHRIQAGEEFYLCFAAHCRVGGGPRWPHEAGTDSQRTRWVRGVWGRNGIQDAEPDYWWQGATEGDEDDMPYRPEDGYTETLQMQIPEGEPGTVERVSATLQRPVHVDLVQVDRRGAPALADAYMRVNAPGGYAVALSPPGVPGAPQHRRPLTVQELVLVVNRPEGVGAGGTVRIVVSGERAGT